MKTDNKIWEPAPIHHDSIEIKFGPRIDGRFEVSSNPSILQKAQLEFNVVKIMIVTTATLSWRTGTAVNPLFRAAFMSKLLGFDVSLMVPWLWEHDQIALYPQGLIFKSPKDQGQFIGSWLDRNLGFQPQIKLGFYPAKYLRNMRSIIPISDTTQYINGPVDMVILEEPEHLNWFHHGDSWVNKCNKVIGVIHTNYLEYIKREKFGFLKAWILKHYNSIVTSIYCHKVLRLSKATQHVPKSIVCNVHGVSPIFLEIGKKVSSEKQQGSHFFTKGGYFLGKMLWAKGYRELIALWSKYRCELHDVSIDVYGSGDDEIEIKSISSKLKLGLNFFNGIDHADESIHRYKVFVNPSISDVLCTATAEALAMGKLVLIPHHPSNEFFMGFSNCLTYKSSDEFMKKLRDAMFVEPKLLTAHEEYKLSWEAAVQRFLHHSEIEEKGFVHDLYGYFYQSLSAAHYSLTGSSALLNSFGLPSCKIVDLPS